MPELDPQNAALLRALPRTDDLIVHLSDAHAGLARPEISAAARRALEEHRTAILEGQAFEIETLSDSVMRRAEAVLGHNTQSAPQRVLNGTGIIVHTGLGRSLLSRAATEAVARVASSHCALEVNIQSGERGKRDASIAALLREITGCEDATVVNNCAGATLIALNSLANQKHVICSRGELVEIGGGFRMPDVMRQSGCHLSEVGTTNKTRLSDYASVLPPDALSDPFGSYYGQEGDTSYHEWIGAILKVHTSNYRVVGFTEEVPLSALVELGRQRGVPVIEDLGSGVMVNLGKVGLTGEPRVQDSVATGADLICFSGDKLLGGPQCGILVGRRPAIELVRKNPLMRALRCDKFTLAALEATLRHYRDEDEAWREIPTLRALAEAPEQVKKRAQRLVRLLRGVAANLKIRDSQAQAGAGALPTQTVPSFALTIAPHELPLQEFARRLRLGEPNVWGRIHDGAFWLDCRTLRDEELKVCADVVGKALAANRMS